MKLKCASRVFVVFALTINVSIGNPTLKAEAAPLTLQKNTAILARGAGASPGNGASLAELRQKYLGQQIIIRTDRYSVVDGRSLLQWQLVMKFDKKRLHKRKSRNSQFFYKGSGIGVPVAYAGRSATIIAVQKSQEGDNQSDEPNALGERPDSQLIGTGILDTVDIVAEFGDGTIAMWSGYPSLLEFSPLNYLSIRPFVILANQPQIIRANLPEVLGSRLYPIRTTKMYEVDATLDEILEDDPLKRISSNVPFLLKPVTIKEAKYIQDRNVIVLKLRLPNGSSALVANWYREHIDPDVQNDSFLAHVSGSLLPEIPAQLTEREVESIRNFQIFKGMSRQAVGYMLGYYYDSNKWGDGGTQVSYQRGSVIVYFDQFNRVVNSQWFDQ